MTLPSKAVAEQMGAAMAWHDQPLPAKLRLLAADLQAMEVTAPKPGDLYGIGLVLEGLAEEAGDA